MWIMCQRSGEDGASAVEYSLVVVAIAAIIVAILFSLGKLTSGAFSTTCTSLEAGDFQTSQTCS
jgi:pilus assembly protein Flp/PilA